MASRGGAGDRADDHAIVLEEGVDDRGLADVGASGDGEVADGGPEREGGVGQPVDDVIEEVGDAEAVMGAERAGVAEAEFVEAGGVGGEGVVVGFVGEEVDGLGGVAEEGGDLGVGGEGAGLHVDDEADGVSFAQGLPHLGGDLVGVGAGQLLAEEPAGIDDAEAVAAPFGFAVEPVAGGAGQILDDGAPAAHEAVEEGGLAHVGATNEGDEGGGDGLVGGGWVRGGGLRGGIRWGRHHTSSLPCRRRRGEALLPPLGRPVPLPPAPAAAAGGSAPD